MPFTRTNPSPRYAELIGLYRRMHVAGDAAHGIAPEAMFPGLSLPRQAHRIKPLIARTGARRILDYGSGKAALYGRPVAENGVRRWASIQEYWGIETLHCYDPAYAPFSTLPGGRFDGVVCTDVMEHCPEEDLGWIVAEMFSYAGRFVFANIACYPAVKTLPNGENAHCTVRPAGYWRSLFERASAGFPGVLWEIWMEMAESNPGASELRAANFEPAPQRTEAGRRAPVWRMV